MAAYLITHSLLSSWLHLIRENPYEDLTTEGDPLAEFMLVLKREPTPRTEAMQNGIDFENLVTAIVNGHDDPNNPWSWGCRKGNSLWRLLATGLILRSTKHF